MKIILLLILPGFVFSQSDSIKFYVDRAELFRFRNPDSIGIMADKLARYGETARSNKAIMYSLILRGVSLHETGQYDSALSQYSAAMKMINKDSIDIGRLLHHQAITHREMGQYEISFEQSIIALRWITDPYLKGMTQLNLAALLNHMNKPKEAIEYASLVLKNNPSVSYAISGALIEIGNAYFSLNMLDSSALQYEKAKKEIDLK